MFNDSGRGKPNMTTVNPTINDTMTRMQLRQIRQKLEEERHTRPSRASVTPRDVPDEQNIKLQHAMLKRQELLDKIRQEKNFREELTHRPATYSARRSRHKAPQESPRRAESLPPPHPENSHSTPRQVIEHQIRPARLDPLTIAPTPPHVLQAAAPAPYLVNVGGQPQVVANQQPNTKAEMMEMMMLQNAQMHQMIMNQMMMQAIPKPAESVSNRSSSRGVEIEDLINRRRPPSVHHHHYDQSRQSTQPMYTLPPVQLPPAMGYPSYPTPRYFPAEMEPLQQPRVKKKTPRPKTPKTPKTAPPPEPKSKKSYGSLPFPGPWPLRRFRHVAYAVFFEKVLEKLLRKRRKRLFPDTALKALNPDFMFGIKLKEAVAAIHAIYLKSTNKVGSIFREYTAYNARDLVVSFNSNKSTENKSATEDLSFIIENVMYEMTDIMPTTGVLGTHVKASTVDMCKNGRLYPKGYMWSIEKERMELDGSGRTRNVQEFQCFMFIVGLFLTRSMVTTLLFKPLEYGLVSEAPSPKAQSNLKLLASVFVYIYRRALVPEKAEPAPLPYEIARSLYPDEEMKDVYKKIKDSLDYADNIIRKWGQEYVTRIQKVLSTSPKDV